MSHVAESQAEIRDLRALQWACAELGLDLVLPEGSRIVSGTHNGRWYTRVMAGAEPAPANQHYRTWKDDHGRFVGDTPPPAGWSAEELGDNAVAVIKLRPEAAATQERQWGTAPYEIGVVPDKTDPTLYRLQYDYFCNGYGLESVVGGHTEVDGQVQLCPTLLQYYSMGVYALTAQESGDELVFARNADGSFVKNAAGEIFATVTTGH